MFVDQLDGDLNFVVPEKTRALDDRSHMIAIAGSNFIAQGYR